MNRPPRWVPVLLAMAVVGGVSPAASAQNPAVPAVSAARPPSAEVLSGSRGLRAGQLLVQSAHGRGGDLERALDRVDGRAAASLGGGLSLVSVPAGYERAAARRLAADPAVASAEPNYLRSADAHATAETGWGVRRTGAPTLWDRTTPLRGAGVRVAVLDSGVSRFVENGDEQFKFRLAKGISTVSTSRRDTCGHGTAVAGVVAAAHDGRHTAGVAPATTVVPVKVLDLYEGLGCGGDDASIIEGINWVAGRDGVAPRADIINMSLSGPQRSSALRDAIRYATGKGILVVAASGNSGDRTVNYPAAYPEVISVGGLQRGGGSVAWWPPASFGSVDVVAAASNVPVLRADTASSPIGAPCSGGGGACASGTSFAAPHVAGVAALLLGQHGEELRAMTPTDRVRRLRQWVLATAPRVPGSSAGSDLKTGHGEVHAVAASDASIDPQRVLLSWRTAERVLAPTSKMVTPASVRMTFVASTGPGEPLAGRAVTFTAPRTATLSRTSGTTDALGSVATVLESTASGRSASVTAEMGSRTLPVTNYVLHRDDNVPGIRLRPSAFSGSLDLTHDFDDVFRVFLRSGETLRARATQVERSGEAVMLFLHRGGTRDVANPFRAPLREDSGYDHPQRLSVTVSSDGVRYLDVYGYGSYRLSWRILSPDIVSAVAASPSSFSPNGDGYRDRTTVKYRLAKAGVVTLRIRNADGRTVRRIDLGRRSRGWRSTGWDGRANSGSLVPSGRYRVVVGWKDGKGRFSSAATNVTVNR